MRGTSSLHPVLGALLLSAVLAACTPEAEPPGNGEAPTSDLVFSFVVLADPHIAGPVAHVDRLNAAVAWVNAHLEERAIERVVVLGDIGWSGGLETARNSLDALAVPYVPVLGDNAVQVGDEQAFEETFAPRFAALSWELAAWNRAALPVWHDAVDGDAWLQNTRFEHSGVLFISQDWNARGVSGALGEFGELNDVAGGSWSWLESALTGASERPRESIVLLSHVPMAPAVFDLAERERFAALVSPFGDQIFANFGGHLHVDYEEEFVEAGYATYVTDATWDDEITLRLVEVWSDGLAMSYEQELIVVD
ncbi:MAG: metallophosphoesterase [Myxococcota bacterium]|nr:metallophosphoesterase [Myxococcota bacterium]